MPSTLSISLKNLEFFTEGAAREPPLKQAKPFSIEQPARKGHARSPSCGGKITTEVFFDEKIEPASERHGHFRSASASCSGKIMSAMSGELIDPTDSGSLNDWHPERLARMTGVSNRSRESTFLPYEHTDSLKQSNGGRTDQMKNKQSLSLKVRCQRLQTQRN